MTGSTKPVVSAFKNKKRFEPMF